MSSRAESTSSRAKANRSACSPPHTTSRSQFNVRVAVETVKFDNIFYGDIAIQSYKIFAELKRRRVYRVALAYGVIASGLIQVGGTILPIFHAPDTV